MATGDSLENLEEILKTEDEKVDGESSDNSDDVTGSESDDEEGTDDGEDEVEGDDDESVEEEDSDEDGDDVEEEDSDEDGDDVEEDGDDNEEEETIKGYDVEKEKNDTSKLFEETDSGGDDIDCCPICLNGLRRQDIGTPEACDHTFCLECIQEWAKNVNTCPVDRQVFHLILARHAGKEKIFKQFPVADKEQNNEEEEEEDDPTFCEVCSQSNHEDRLLLCDGCDRGYHCDCLTPPLAQVPVDAWFCPDCCIRRGICVDVNLPRQTRRQIGRTLISERVRRSIQDYRAERAERRLRVTAMIQADEDGEDDDEELPGPSSRSPSVARPKRTSSKARKRKTTKRKSTKKKTTKKKVTRKRKSTTKSKGKGKGKKRKKKKTKKRSTPSSAAAARTVRLPPPSSVKGRIADKLGLSKPPVGRSIPLQKVPSGTGSSRDFGGHRVSEVGTATLSLLGNKDELYCFAETEGEERQIVNRPAIPAEQLLSRSALLSHSKISITQPVKRKLDISKPPAAVASSSATGFDFLGSIMMKQDMLAKGSSQVTINRDGSLSAKNSNSSLSSSPHKSPSKAASTSSTIHASSSSSSLSSTTSTTPSTNTSSISNQKRSLCLSQATEKDNDESDSKKHCIGLDDQDAISKVRINQTVTGHNDLDTGADSDDELANFCMKTENLQQEESKVDGDKCESAQPSVGGAADIAIKEEIKSEDGVESQPCHAQLSNCLDISNITVKTDLVDTVLIPPHFAEVSREEGEASDSGEEGEIRSDDEGDGMGNGKMSCDDEQEEGEIIEEEEKADAETVPSRESEVDVKVEANIVTFKSEDIEFANDSAKDQSSKEKDANSDIQASDKQIDIDISIVKEEIKEEVIEEEVDDESDYDPYDPKNGSFLIARFLHSIVTNEFDRKKEAAERREIAERKREEEEKRKEEEEERIKREANTDLSDHKISILDFLGNAGHLFGVAAESPSSRGQGRSRGRGNVKPIHFGIRRGSLNEDSRSIGRGGGNRDISIPVNDHRYDGETQDMGENSYFHERQMHNGPRPDFHDRRGRNHRPDISMRGDMRPRRNSGEDRKRKRENSVSHSVNGLSRKERSSRKERDRRKRRKYEERGERRHQKYHRKRQTNERSGSSSSSDSSSSGSSESDGEGGSGNDSSSSDNSVIRPVEMPAIPSPPVSPYPSLPSDSSPPPPPPPPMSRHIRSPHTPPPPPHPAGPSSPRGHISTTSGPPQQNHAPGHPSGHATHPNYEHIVHRTGGQATHDVRYPPEPNLAPPLSSTPSGQPRPMATYPPTYRYPHQPHPLTATSGGQNPPAHAHPSANAYPQSAPAYPASGYPYHPQSHPHAYPSSYYPAGQNRPVAPTTQHSSSAGYPHYPGASYPAASSTTVPHPQHHPTTYSSSRPQQQQATSHPYYHPTGDSHRPSVPQQTYGYPHRQPYPASVTVPSAIHPHASHPSQHVASSHGPQYSNPYHASHSHPASTHHAKSAGVRQQQDVAIPHQSQRHFQVIKESPQKKSPKPEVKSSRLIYRPSPPTVRGVATSDRLASNLLHDEVKKGFRQLVEDAVRSALRPAWCTRRINKDIYKDIFKKCIDKVCGSKETVVQQDKIQSLVDAYVAKARKAQT